MRCLIVEDVWLIAADLQMLLEELGHEVVGIVRCSGAIERVLDAKVVDCVFLDYDLGGGTTAEPLVALLTKAGIPFVWTSARQGLGDGPALCKPFRVSELSRILDDLRVMAAVQ